MPRQNRIKVCLVVISLAKGGAERSTALLSQMLYSKGYDVHIVILNNEVDYEYSGKLFNLGKIKTEEDSVVKRLLRFEKLRKFLKLETFDFIIDNRTRQSAFKEWYYSKHIYKGIKSIYVVRSANLAEYFPKNKRITKEIIKKSCAIIGVSKHIANDINLLYNTDKAISIYNPAPNFKVTNEQIDGEYIIFAGRLQDDVKNISLLLNSYAQSELPKENVSLKILGDGSDKDFLIHIVETLNILDKVEFISFTPNVYPYLKNALFSVLTSRYEGFPRSLIESLSVGTPVISVDCISGPNEIIINEMNGLLVPNFDANALADAMNRFIFDQELYNRCKRNSSDSISHLNFEKIAEEWDTLLKNKYNECR